MKPGRSYPLDQSLSRRYILRTALCNIGNNKEVKFDGKYEYEYE